jgi:Domain of unknown function (DUF1707)/Cell wall-active antibiotics response 4TMS YvqF
VTSQPPDLRVSDADRERVAERLREAAGAGRLTVDELDERVERAYAARTAGELTTLTADLPATPGAALPGKPAQRKPRRWLVSIMGGGNLRGRWRAGEKLTVVSLMSGGNVDLRHAQITSREIHITAISVMGGVDVIVPAGVDVEVTGFALMGGYDDRVPVQDLPADAPRVHVRAISLMGGVTARMKRSERKALEAANEPPSLPDRGA